MTNKIIKIKRNQEKNMKEKYFKRIKKFQMRYNKIITHQSNNNHNNNKNQKIKKRENYKQIKVGKSIIQKLMMMINLKFKKKNP